MLSWTIGQKVPKPKCFQKCFISLHSTRRGCCLCPAQMSTPTPAHPAIQLSTRTQTAWPSLWFGHFRFGIAKKGHSCITAATAGTNDSTFQGWEVSLGDRQSSSWLPYVLLGLQQLFLEQQRKLKKPRDSLSPSPPSDLPYPRAFLVLGTRKSEQVKDRSNTTFTNFPP